MSRKEKTCRLQDRRLEAVFFGTNNTYFLLSFNYSTEVFLRTFLFFFQFVEQELQASSQSLQQRSVRSRVRIFYRQMLLQTLACQLSLTWHVLKSPGTWNCPFSKYTIFQELWGDSRVLKRYRRCKVGERGREWVVALWAGEVYWKRTSMPSANITA